MRKVRMIDNGTWVHQAARMRASAGEWIVVAYDAAPSAIYSVREGGFKACRPAGLYDAVMRDAYRNEGVQRGTLWGIYIGALGPDEEIPAPPPANVLSVDKAVYPDRFGDEDETA